VRLVGYVAVAYLVLKLIPTLTRALSSLEHVRWQWLLAALALELISEIGFVLAWRAILDPEDLLGRDEFGQRVDTQVAWAQLGSGTLVPGGSWGGMGVGSWILHRFGMPTKQIAERQFNLSFLNTAIDALTVIVFGLALASGVVLVLWSAFFAIHASPVPGFAVVVMAYIIGALGGSIPLPAAAGTVGGIAAVLVLYGVDHNPAIAAVLLHQAIALVVPLAGGGIAYAVLRRQFGAMRASDAGDSHQD
jgi:uncharacterized membrane protein YbhN (UPF0104 family)